MRPALALVAGALLLAGLAACEHKPSKEEEEAAKNTFACRLAGQRLVIREQSVLQLADLLEKLVSGMRSDLQSYPSKFIQDVYLNYTSGSRFIESL